MADRNDITTEELLSQLESQSSYTELMQALSTRQIQEEEMARLLTSMQVGSGTLLTSMSKMSKNFQAISSGLESASKQMDAAELADITKGIKALSSIDFETLASNLKSFYSAVKRESSLIQGYKGKKADALSQIDRSTRQLDKAYANVTGSADYYSPRRFIRPVDTKAFEKAGFGTVNPTEIKVAIAKGLTQGVSDKGVVEAVRNIYSHTAAAALRYPAATGGVNHQPDATVASHSQDMANIIKYFDDELDSVVEALKSDAIMAKKYSSDSYIGKTGSQLFGMFMKAYKFVPDNFSDDQAAALYHSQKVRDYAVGAAAVHDLAKSEGQNRTGMKGYNAQHAESIGNKLIGSSNPVADYIGKLASVHHMGTKAGDQLTSMGVDLFGKASAAFMMMADMLSARNKGADFATTDGYHMRAAGLRDNPYGADETKINRALLSAQYKEDPIGTVSELVKMASGGEYSHPEQAKVALEELGLGKLVEVIGSMSEDFRKIIAASESVSGATAIGRQAESRLVSALMGDGQGYISGLDHSQLMSGEELLKNIAAVEPGAVMMEMLQPGFLRAFTDSMLQRSSIYDQSHNAQMAKGWADEHKPDNDTLNKIKNFDSIASLLPDLRTVSAKDLPDYFDKLIQAMQGGPEAFEKFLASSTDTAKELEDQKAEIQKNEPKPIGPQAPLTGADISRGGNTSVRDLEGTTRLDEFLNAINSFILKNTQDGQKVTDVEKSAEYVRTVLEQAMKVARGADAGELERVTGAGRNALKTYMDFQKIQAGAPEADVAKTMAEAAKINQSINESIAKASLMEARAIETRQKVHENQMTQPQRMAQLDMKVQSQQLKLEEQIATQADRVLQIKVKTEQAMSQMTEEQQAQIKAGAKEALDQAKANVTMPEIKPVVDQSLLDAYQEKLKSVREDLEKLGDDSARMASEVAGRTAGGDNPPSPPNPPGGSPGSQEATLAMLREQATLQGQLDSQQRQARAEVIKLRQAELSLMEQQMTSQSRMDSEAFTAAQKRAQAQYAELRNRQELINIQVSEATMTDRIEQTKIQTRMQEIKLQQAIREEALAKLGIDQKSLQTNQESNKALQSQVGLLQAIGAAATARKNLSNITPEGIDPASQFSLVNPAGLSGAGVSGGNLAYIAKNALFAVSNQISGIGSWQQLIQKGISDMKDYETALVNISRVWQDVPYAQVTQAMRDLNEITIQYGQTVQNVAEIQEAWAKVGIESASELRDLSEVSILALNTSDLKNADDAVTYLNSARIQMGLTIDEVDNLLDSWNKLADVTTADTSDFAEAYQKSAGYAKQMGLNFRELDSIIATMIENTGRSGQEIGTALRQIFSNTFTERNLKKLQGLGIEIYSDEDKVRLKEFDVLVGDIAQKYKELKAQAGGGMSQDLITLLNVMGQTRQRNYAIALLEGYDKTGLADNNAAGTYTSISQDSGGYSQRKFEMTMDTLQYKATQLQAAMTQAFAAAGNSGILDLLKSATDGLTGLAKGFADMDPHLRNFVTQFAAILTVNTAINKIMKSTFGQTGSKMLVNMIQQAVRLRKAMKDVQTVTPDLSKSDAKTAAKRSRVSQDITINGETIDSEAYLKRLHKNETFQVLKDEYAKTFQEMGLSAKEAAEEAEKALDQAALAGLGQIDAVKNALNNAATESTTAINGIRSAASAAGQNLSDIKMPEVKVSDVTSDLSAGAKAAKKDVDDLSEALEEGLQEALEDQPPKGIKNIGTAATGAADDMQELRDVISEVAAEETAEAVSSQSAGTANAQQAAAQNMSAGAATNEALAQKQATIQDQAQAVASQEAAAASAAQAAASAALSMGLTLLISLLATSVTSAITWHKASTEVTESTLATNSALRDEVSNLRDLFRQYDSAQTKLSELQEGTKAYADTEAEVLDITQRLADAAPNIGVYYDYESGKITRNIGQIREYLSWKEKLLGPANVQDKDLLQTYVSESEQKEKDLAHDLAVANALNDIYTIMSLNGKTGLTDNPFYKPIVDNIDVPGGTSVPVFGEWQINTDVLGDYKLPDGVSINDLTSVIGASTIAGNMYKAIEKRLEDDYKPSDLADKLTQQAEKTNAYRNQLAMVVANERNFSYDDISQLLQNAKVERERAMSDLDNDLAALDNTTSNIADDITAVFSNKVVTTKFNKALKELVDFFSDDELKTILPSGMSLGTALSEDNVKSHIDEIAAYAETLLKEETSSSIDALSSYTDSLQGYSDQLKGALDKKDEEIESYTSQMNAELREARHQASRENRTLTKSEEESIKGPYQAILSQLQTDRDLLSNEKAQIDNAITNLNDAIREANMGDVEIEVPDKSALAQDFISKLQKAKNPIDKKKVLDAIAQYFDDTPLGIFDELGNELTLGTATGSEPALVRAVQNMLQTQIVGPLDTAADIVSKTKVVAAEKTGDLIGDIYSIITGSGMEDEDITSAMGQLQALVNLVGDAFEGVDTSISEAFQEDMDKFAEKYGALDLSAAIAAFEQGAVDVGSLAKAAGNYIDTLDKAYSGGLSAMDSDVIEACTGLRDLFGDLMVGNDLIAEMSNQQMIDNAGNITSAIDTYLKDKSQLAYDYCQNQIDVAQAGIDALEKLMLDAKDLIQDIFDSLPEDTKTALGGSVDNWINSIITTLNATKQKFQNIQSNMESPRTGKGGLASNYRGSSSKSGSSDKWKWLTEAVKHIEHNVKELTNAQDRLDKIWSKTPDNIDYLTEAYSRQEDTIQGLITALDELRKLRAKVKDQEKGEELDEKIWSYENSLIEAYQKLDDLFSSKLNAKLAPINKSQNRLDTIYSKSTTNVDYLTKSYKNQADTIKILEDNMTELQQKRSEIADEARGLAMDEVILELANQLTEAYQKLDDLFLNRLSANLEPYEKAQNRLDTIWANATDNAQYLAQAYDLQSKKIEQLKSNIHELNLERAATEDAVRGAYLDEAIWEAETSLISAIQQADATFKSWIDTALDYFDQAQHRLDTLWSNNSGDQVYQDRTYQVQMEHVAQLYANLKKVQDLLAEETDKAKIAEYEKQIREYENQIISNWNTLIKLDTREFDSKLTGLNLDFEILSKKLELANTQMHGLAPGTQLLDQAFKTHAANVEYLQAKYNAIQDEMARVRKQIEAMQAIAAAGGLEGMVAEANMTYLINYLKELEKQATDVVVSAEQARQQWVTTISNYMQKIWKQQYDEKVKAVQKLRKEQQKAHNERIKQIQEELDELQKAWDKEDDARDMADLESKIALVKMRIRRLSADTSQYGQKLLQEAYKELGELERQYNDKKNQADRDQAKEELQNQIDKENEAWDKMQEQFDKEEQAYQDQYNALLENAEAFAQGLYDRYLQSQQDIVDFLQSAGLLDAYQKAGEMQGAAYIAGLTGSLATNPFDSLLGYNGDDNYTPSPGSTWGNSGGEYPGMFPGTNTIDTSYTGNPDNGNGSTLPGVPSTLPSTPADVTGGDSTAQDTPNYQAEIDALVPKLKEAALYSRNDEYGQVLRSLASLEYQRNQKIDTMDQLTLAKWNAHKTYNYSDENGYIKDFNYWWIRYRQEAGLDAWDGSTPDSKKQQTTTQPTQTTTQQPTQTPTQPQTRTYTVVKGDSLWEIAKKMLGSGSRWGEIPPLNGHTWQEYDNKTWVIHPGDVLKIPAAHTGGVAGVGDLPPEIQEMFGLAPSETIIKALRGEYMIPEAMMENLIPTISASVRALMAETFAAAARSISVDDLVNIQIPDVSIPEGTKEIDQSTNIDSVMRIDHAEFNDPMDLETLENMTNQYMNRSLTRKGIVGTNRRR